MTSSTVFVILTKLQANFTNQGTRRYISQAEIPPLAPPPAMPAFLEPPSLEGPRYDKPVPRPPKTPAKTKDIRSHNRRREFLIRNPQYFQSPEHQLAGLCL